MERLDVLGEELDNKRPFFFGNHVDDSLTGGNVASNGAESPPDQSGALNVLLNALG